MKRKLTAALVLGATLWTLQLTAFAQEEPAAAPALNLGSAGKFFGVFLLVMLLIYGAVHLTAWIGKKWGKH